MNSKNGCSRKKFMTVPHWQDAIMRNLEIIGDATNYPKAHEINQWLLKADHYLRSAQQLFKAKPPLLDTAVYHCQQTAEKALKAYLTFQDLPFAKTSLGTPACAIVTPCTMSFPRRRESRHHGSGNAVK